MNAAYSDADLKISIDALTAARKALALVPTNAADESQQCVRRVAEWVEKTITSDAALCAAMEARLADGRPLVNNPAAPDPFVRAAVAAKKMREVIVEEQDQDTPEGQALLKIADLAESLATDAEGQLHAN